jgi:hypothetical protein
MTKFPSLPALDLAKPAETARYKPTQKVLVLKGFLSIGAFHRIPKYSPHDFAVRSNIVRPRAVDRSQAHENPPCDPIARFDAAASTASRTQRP